jgi:transketolase
MKNGMSAKRSSQYFAKALRFLVVDMAYRTKTGHVGSSLSIVDIMAVLMTQVLHFDAKNPKQETRDRFLLSKGHAGGALYASLALAGYFPVSYCIDGGIFHGHPSRQLALGIEFSTGSLGHGICVGVGVAHALQLKNIRSRVYVLVGDGECNEGSVTEAMHYASTHKLNNLTVIIDDNGFQGFGQSQNVFHINHRKLWTATGWEYFSVPGHDHTKLMEVLSRARKSSLPSVVHAKTTSGRGIRHIENTLAAHYWSPDEKTWTEECRIAGEKIVNMAYTSTN